MKNSIIILLLGFIFAFENNPWATFNVPSNANDFSLSRSNISDGSIGFYQFSNPALLSKTIKYDFGMGYNMMSLDRSTQVISLNVSLPPKAGIGLSIIRSGTSDIQGTDIYNNNTHIFDTYDMMGIMSFGSMIFNFKKINISTGVNIKVSYSNLDNILSNNSEPNYSIFNKGIGIDIGILIDYKDKLSFGFKTENIASSKNWDLDLRDNSSAYEENIPIIYKIGGHYKPLNILTLYMSFESSEMNLNYFSPRGNNILKSGISYHDKQIGVLGGFSWQQFLEFGKTASNIISPSLGVYYQGKIWKDKSIKLNYGIDFGGVSEGISHIFTWTFIN